MPSITSRVILAVVTVLLLAGVTGCDTSGNQLASQAADDAAERARVQLSDLDRARDAETLAAGLRSSSTTYGDPGQSVLVLPLVWSGAVAQDRTATIEVQIVTQVPERHATEVFGSSNTAGSATRCYRLVATLYRDATVADEECPALTTTSTPVPSPIPRLPDDSEQRVRRALTGATAGTVDARVRAQFAEPGVIVETAAEDGELIAAVGVPAERDCLVLVRDRRGTIAPATFDRIWLEPGETGCSTRLYTDPPR